MFLETVAGVPGMVAAALRHMRSLRRMERDNGWIHTLLEEVAPPSGPLAACTLLGPPVHTPTSGLELHVGAGMACPAAR